MTTSEISSVTAHEISNTSIVNDPQVVWTLYNTGYFGKKGPHSNPKGGELSEFAMKYYKEMGCLLD